MTHTIDFEPLGRRGDGREGESLLAGARRLGAGINSICGGQGTCRSCRVKVLSGTVSAPTPHEREALTPRELAEGWRLACQTYPSGDVRLMVPPESMTTPQRTQFEGLEIAVAPEPSAQARRLQKAIPGPMPGLAVDLGTTKIAAYLVDLESGRTMAAGAVMNPQISWGEDIISRINHAVKSPDAGVQLQKAAVAAINGLAADLGAQAGTAREAIVEAVVVGNTAMHHLFLGLPAKPLALAPFTPAVKEAVDTDARELGLDFAPGASVHLLPNIAGFVGADHVAMLLAVAPWLADTPALALDIGTNTEVSLVDGEKITSASCASGPAFEGGHIKDGMRAARGAIERVRIAGDSVQYQTIDQAPPAGICGSGLLDAVAQMYLAGILDEGGRLAENHPRVRTRRGQREFVLADEAEREGRPAIVITQHDVRELQLAKAAIRAGIQVLLETGGREEDEIRQVIMAGAFGTYLDVESAMTIGMLPALPPDRFRQAGNAAGTGARLALISLSQRARAADIAAGAGYIELAGAPGFEATFIQASYLGKYRLKKGRRVRI
jgi:uncharacterized 2Fe-2S/4Fe-4S cluster protein (DUF4445 family)